MATVHIAVVEHEYGMDVLYAGMYEKNAYKALATYARNWWVEEEVDMETGIEDPAEVSDQEVIQAYFNSEVVMNKCERGVVESVELQDEQDGHALGCAMHVVSSAECTCGKAEKTTKRKSKP